MELLETDLEETCSATSQTMLHMLQQLLLIKYLVEIQTLYDFTILFPAVIGSLTVVVIFALVDYLQEQLLVLFASLFFAVSLYQYF